MSAAAYNPGVRFFLLGALVLGGAPGAPAEEGGRELPGEWSRFRRPFSEAYWIYEAPAAFRGGEYDGGGTPHVTVNEFRARTAVPLLRNETLIATAGAALQWDHFFFTGISFENIDTWIMGVPFFVSWKPGGTWRLSAAVTPSLYSDLKRVTRDAFGAGGALMASYSWAPGQSVSA
ncbi:MAG TPA: hypothetical protein PK636_06945, partial [bacterium]|nr:hypothetical protein [bacterium]